jgi:hypothetical protein
LHDRTLVSQAGFSLLRFPFLNFLRLFGEKGNCAYWTRHVPSVPPSLSLSLYRVVAERSLVVFINSKGLVESGILAVRSRALVAGYDATAHSCLTCVLS